MHRVFKSHVEANRGRLNMDTMLKQIQALCDVLSIPSDNAQSENVACSPIPSKRCICKPNKNSRLQSGTCACTIERSSLLVCDQHCISLPENISSPLQDEIDPLTGDITNIEEVIREEELLCQDVHSLSCVTERTEPTTSSVTCASFDFAQCCIAKEINQNELKEAQDATNPLSDNIPIIILPISKTDTTKITECNDYKKQLTDNPEDVFQSVNSTDTKGKHISISHSESTIENRSVKIREKIMPNKSTMQIVQVTQKSNIKVRGPNNEVIEYILPPGPIYIPKNTHLKYKSDDLMLSPTYSEIHAEVIKIPHYTSSLNPAEQFVQPQIKPQEIMDHIRNSKDLQEQSLCLLSTDYDLTPQRDSSTCKDLLLSDKYEIKNTPDMISKFYPDIATQTQSSDWINESKSSEDQEAFAKTLVSGSSPFIDVESLSRYSYASIEAVRDIQNLSLNSVALSESEFELEE